MKTIISAICMFAGIMSTMYVAKAFDRVSIWKGDVTSGWEDEVIRIYDSENGVICYVYENRGSHNGGISCVKQ